MTVGLRLHDGILEARSAPRDSAEWSLAQLEIEVLRLADEAATLPPGGDLASVRRRFDIVYSRVATVAEGRMYADLRAEPEIRRSIARLRAGVSALVPLVDGPDDRLRARLGRLAGSARELREPARTISLAGVTIFADLADGARARFEWLLVAAAAVATGLIVLLALTLLVLFRLYRLSAARAQEASRSRERLAAAINASLDAIVVIDSAGRIVEVNRAAETVLGHPREAALGAPMADLMVPPRYRTAHRAGMRRFLATGERRIVDRGRVELTAQRADGTEFPVELSIGSAADRNGSIFIAYLRDISDRLAAERALTEARDEAMAAARAKSEFIAVMSHEMRTPLNGVLGLLELLSRTGLDARQRRYVETATRSGELLLAHVNDVLDIARIEKDRLEHEIAPLDIAAMLSEAVSVTELLAAKNGNRVVVVADAAPPLAGDARRLGQVLLNLLSNASKFTEGGRIELGFRVVSEREDGAEVAFSVSDTGIGIPEDAQARIFEDFVMLDGAYSRKASGTGLGLGICRRIVEALGGTIELESRPGAGSRFTVRLCLSRTGVRATASGPAVSAAAAGPLDILLVEDTETNRLVARDMLEAGGHRVVEAHDGREGVAMAGTRRFDAILMDISMPEMDGVEATRAIRAGEGPNRTTPVIGLTAHALPEERTRFAEAGMDDCLLKPVRLDALAGALARIAGAATAPPTAADAEMPEPAEPAERPEEEDEDDEPIDAAVFSALAAGLGPDQLTATLAQVVRDLRGGLARLAAADDPAAEWPLAHGLAGTAAIVGARKLHAALADLETAGKRHDREAARAALSRAGDEARAALAILAELATEPG